MIPHQKILLHSTIAKDAPMTIDLKIASDLGYDGLELSAAKMRTFLAADWTETDLIERLRPFDIPGIGFLMDIERHGLDEAALIEDANTLFRLAQQVDARGVQVITGPVSVAAARAYAKGQGIAGYRGVLGLPWAEQMEITARNLARLADMAAEMELILYLEALSWCPLNTIADQLELIARAGRDNVKLVIDFWHCYVSGDTPDCIAQIDKNIIYGVHVCDSRQFHGGIPDESLLRDVPTGSGVLDLRAWVNAVKATGFVGWWSGELFCRRQHQDDSFRVAADIKQLIQSLIF